MTLAIPDPTTATLDVWGVCEQIEAWAQAEADARAIKEAADRLAAIDEYLARTATEGRARVAATLRRLKVRIGQLLGPAKVGRPSG